MTYAQTQKLLILKNKTKKAYSEFQKNSDKNKKEKLEKNWLECIDKEEKFILKYA